MLAEGVSGSVPAFVMEMNARAFDLGMHQTIFTNPQGYDDEKQCTTARDLAKLCRKLAEYETLQPYFQTWRDFLRGEATELVNENTFSRTYEGHIGFKASHTEQSGWCLAEGSNPKRNDLYCSCSERYGRPTICGCQTAAESRLFPVSVMQPLFSDEFLKPLTVKGGVSTAVRFTADDVHGVVVPKAEPDLTAVLQLPSYIEAPRTEGQKNRKRCLLYGDTMLYETALVTTEPVGSHDIFSCFCQNYGQNA